MNQFKAKVRSLSSDGSGVVDHPDGFVVFVPGTWPGDVGLFEILQKKKRYALGKLIELHEISSERIEARCPHFGIEEGRCGGCLWQIGTYASQLEVKQSWVQRELEKLGLKDFEGLREIKASPREWGYRNRARLRTDGKSIGYISPQSHRLAPINDCLILNDSNRDKLQGLKGKLPFKLLKNSSKNNADQMPYIDIDEDLNVENLELNKSMPFKQANDEQNNFMKSWLAEQLGSKFVGAGAVELFSGSGNFTQVLVKSGLNQVLAFEGDKQSTEKLKLRKLKGVRAETTNLFTDKFVKDYSEEISKAKLLVLDPPRDGWKNKARFLEQAKSLKAIVYVSCHLATFSRDLRDFMEAGYSLTLLQPVDQFPQTPHLEIMAYLTRSCAHSF